MAEFVYMMDYHPYHGGNNPYHDEDSQTLVYLKRGTVYDPMRKKSFLSRIKDFLEKLVLELVKQATETGQPQRPIVLTLAPGHGPGSQSGFLLPVIKDLVGKYPGQLIDGSTQLVRTTEVPKSTTTPGPRDESKHRCSIKVCAPPAVKVETLNAGKIVFVIDDVWTSGATLSVCGEKMSTTGALDVKLVAVGKTVSYR